MKILLSPAKSIDTKKKIEIDSYTTPIFLEEANKLVSKLKKLKAKKLGEMMHISPELAELNELRYKNWQDPIAPSDEIIQSIFAFSGEVYRGFDAYSLSTEEIQRAQQRIRILSGLYGILKPLDLLYPYRLEMGTKWMITPKTKNLYQFWGKKIAMELNSELENEEVVLNLASAEYFKAVDKKSLKHKVITPVFKEFKNGEYKVVMMFAKHARGAMARYVIQKNVTDPELLKLYDVDGYQFDVNQSSNDEWVFVR